MLSGTISVSELASRLAEAPGGSDLHIFGTHDKVIDHVTIDSRTAQEGTLFVALQGENAHGAQYASSAISRGCRAVLTDQAGHEIILKELATSAEELSLLVCSDPRQFAAYVADEVYGRPSALFPVIGVTGTNGKTSVTTMCARTMQALGTAAGIMGTNGTFLTWPDQREERIPTERTTPESPDVHRLLAHMHAEGMEAAALEVSSHAMVFHRADAVRFRVVAFTNLSQDHLDFHSSMQEYFEAKAALFTPTHASAGVICVDDEWGNRLARETQIASVTYSTAGADADYKVTQIRSQGFRSEFTVIDREGDSFTFTSALPGRHNVANTLAVALILEHLGFDRGAVASALGSAGVVPGRMERVGSSDACPYIVVDYSHTPDALEHTLLTLRDLPGVERVITVMGAGGKRDTTKRPKMGAVSAELSDVVIVTDDNPRGDDPAQIRDQIIAGVDPHASCVVHNVADRAEAIAMAVAEATASDVVLIAGKGAETGQDLGDRTIEFDDRIHAQTALDAWVQAVGHKESSHA